MPRRMEQLYRNNQGWGNYLKSDVSFKNFQGGPQPLDHTQILLLVSPGLDRSPAVGFRCVKDIDKNNFNVKK